jgi:hypothetical protein
MRHLATILIWLIAVMAIAAPLSISALSRDSNDAPAGCHEHGSKMPAKVPPDYSCCLAGHSDALPQFLTHFSPSLKTAQLQVAAFSQASPVEPEEAARFDSATAPPGILSLRI